MSAVAAMVSANWRYIWPVMPLRNAVGMNTAIRTSVIEMTGPVTSFMAWMVASRGGIASLDVVRGVLDDHDGVVHHDADREDEAEEREQVDREAQERHERERADDRDRHRRRGDEQCPPALEEHQDDDQHQSAGLDQRQVDLVDRRRDELRGVERDASTPCPAGSVGLIFSIAAADALGDVERVGAGQAGR